MRTVFQFTNHRPVQIWCHHPLLLIVRSPQRVGVCGFAGQKNPSSGVPAAFARCKGPVLLVINNEAFRITVNNSASENRPTVFFTLSSGKSAASVFITFSSPETPVNKTVQSVFSSNSRIISLYCSSFKFGAEAPLPECNIT